METLAKIVDKLACGSAVGANTGKLGCLSLFGEPTHFMLISKGMVIPKETVFDLTFLRPMVQKGLNIPLIDAASFEDISGEDSMSTNSKNIERLNLKGLPKYRFGFEEGHEFYRELSKLTSFKSKDVIIGDEEGNWMFAKNANGDYTGFSAGQIVAEMRKTKQSGGDAESKSLTIQFLNRLQWDTNYGIIHADSINWTPQEVPLINGVNLSFMAIPSDAETTISIKAVLSSDNSTAVSGLVVADFLVTNDGITVVPSLVTEGADGEYVLTIAAISTGDVLFVDLWDGTLNVNAINSNDVLYRSEGVTETVII